MSVCIGRVDLVADVSEFRVSSRSVFSASKADLN